MEESNSPSGLPPVGEQSVQLDTVSDLYARQCAAEAIHLLGEVQPHGFVLVVDLRSGEIIQVSTGVTRHWPGLDDPQRLLGTALDDWIVPQQVPCLAVLQALPREAIENLDLCLRDGHAGATEPALGGGFECVGHCVGYCAVLEWIPTGNYALNALYESEQMMRLNRALTKLRHTSHLDEFFKDCVAELHAICRYDRVMLYRFLPDWSGEIVAEHTGPGFERKFLGLRFPASDIPPQARTLYESNTLRVLADVQASPDALLPARLPDGLPLDQSHCMLRSLSRAHLAYMRNMGVRATLTISLLHGGKLWGMLSCHHHQPMVPPHTVQELMRSACALIANVVAMRIDDLDTIAQSQKLADLGLALSELSLALHHQDNLVHGMRSHASALCKVFDASDFGFRIGASDFVASASADSARQRAILDEVAGHAANLAAAAIVQVTDLRCADRAVLAYQPQVAGLLLVRLPPGSEGFCFFARPELVQQVQWAGEPTQFMAVTDEGRIRLEPRRSFALWQQSVAGCAQPWSAADEQAAGRLATVLDDVHKSQLTRELRSQLHWRTHHDHLTGLLNRGVIEQELARRFATGVGCMALFLIDIDHFKRINDSLGHTVGDKVLQEASRRLTSVIRGHDLLARLGGDEFVLISDIGNVERSLTETIARRLHEVFVPTFKSDDWSLRIGVSVGVAFSPDHGDDAATLLRHADMALYEAKGQGRSRSVVYDPGLESRMLHAVALEDQLRQAVTGSELRLFYQPKVDLRSQRVVSLEALVRWQHPKRGLLGPDQFIALAERSGLVEGLGHWVIGEAVAQLARWRAAGQTVWPVAVNVSFVQIVNGSVVSDIVEFCRQHAVPPELLELELTETVLMENTQKTVATIEQVKKLGMKVALDDFGTGYSSLAYVRQLPLDYLKIDRSFVTSLESDAQSHVVTSGVIGLARGLGLVTIAEGVETEAQWRWLLGHGCQIGQGYLFSRAVGADDLHAVAAAIESASWTQPPVPTTRKAATSVAGATVSPITRLRMATDDLHRELDQRSAMSRLLLPGLSLSTYADVLTRLYPCFAEIEAALDIFVGSVEGAGRVADPRTYRRTPDLLADRVALAEPLLGYTDNSLWLAAACRPEHSLLIQNLSEAVGCMYVVAGSTLGAQIIARTLRAEMGDKIAGALRFFGGSDRALPQGWPATRKKLNALLEDESTYEVALAKAREVFGLFIRHLTGPTPRVAR